MTITQRIELRRLGYTKEEIAELAELEKNPPEVTETAEAETEEATPVEAVPTSVVSDAPDIQAQLLNAINNLTTVLQTQKLNTAAQPEVKKETADDIFTNLLKG